jgi:hypothetical protein
VADVLHTMVEKGITHMPMVEASPILVQLVAGGNRHEIVTRLITDIADTATRRLLALAEPRSARRRSPICGSPAAARAARSRPACRDQDNCLILDDAVTEPTTAYFAALARFVSDGLDDLRLLLLPRRHDGDQSALVPAGAGLARLFPRLDRKPNPEAQMLASVMFDLRPIGGRDGCSTICRRTRWRPPRRTRSSWRTWCPTRSSTRRRWACSGLRDDPVGRAQEPARPEAQRRRAGGRPGPDLRAAGAPDRGQHPRRLKAAQEAGSVSARPARAT